MDFCPDSACGIVDECHDHAPQLAETRRRLRLIESGVPRLPGGVSGAMMLIDAEGLVVSVDARAAKALAAAGIDIDAQRSVPIEMTPLKQRPQWLRAARVDAIVVGGVHMGWLVVFPEHAQSAVEAERGALPRYKVRRVMDFIEAHIDEPIRLEQLSATVAVSPFYFHRQFKKSTGVTPHQYVLRARIKRAQALLAQPDLPLVEVAARVGFADQSQFTNSFRRLTSMTPKVYRNAVLEGVLKSEVSETFARNPQ